MTEAEARALMRAAIATDDTPTIMDAFDRLDANGFAWMFDGITWGEPEPCQTSTAR